LTSTETSSSSGFNQQLVISNHPVNEEHTYSSPHAGSHQIKSEKSLSKKIKKKEKLPRKKRKSHHVQFDQRTITTPQESLEVVNDIDLPEVGMEEEISCVNAADQSDADTISDDMLSDNEDDFLSSDTEDASEGISDDEECHDSRGTSGNRLFDSGYSSMKNFRVKNSQKKKQNSMHKKHHNKQEGKSKRSNMIATDTDVSSEPEIQQKVSRKKIIAKRQSRKRSANEKYANSENKNKRRSSNRIKSPSRRMQESMKQTKKKIKTDRKISKKLDFQKPKAQQKLKSKKQISGTKRKLKNIKNDEASTLNPAIKKRRKDKVTLKGKQKKANVKEKSRNGKFESAKRVFIFSEVVRGKKEDEIC